MEENQLDDATGTGYSFLDSNKSNARRFIVIRRIFDYTKGKLDKNESVEFSWMDIGEQADVDDVGDKLKKSISEAIEELDKQHSELNKIALNNGFSFFPRLKKTESGGGAGNTNKYKITAHPVDLEPLDIDIPVGHIRYSLEKIAQPNIFARLINNYTAEGAKFGLLIGGLTASICLCLILGMFGFYAIFHATTVIELLKMLIFFSALGYSLYYLLSPLYYCLSQRIVTSPLLLTPSDIKTAQLEYVATTKKTDSGRPIRKFRIVTYSASCPICDGRIELEEGRRRMAGRLVGCCSESPREHVFSFDHKTRSGKAYFDEYRSWL